MNEAQLKYIKKLVKSGGECSGEIECSNCIIREHLEDIDDCSIDECYDIAYKLLQEYDSKYGIEGSCIPIW